jgi:hypothetical protein
MNNLDHYIDYLLDLVLSEIEPIDKNIDKVMFLKTSKNKYSSKGVAQKLEITTTALDELEFRLKNYFDKKNDKILDETNALRLIVSLEYIIKIKKITKSKELVKDGKKEQDSVKHVRVLELIVRDIVYDQIGDNELLLMKLAEIFNDDEDGIGFYYSRPDDVSIRDCEKVGDIYNNPTMIEYEKAIKELDKQYPTKKEK